MDLAYDETAAALGLGAAHEPWRDSFERSLPLVDDRDPLPTGAALRARCRELRFPEEVIGPLAASADAAAKSAPLRRVLAHARWMVRHEVPRVGPWVVPWVPLPEALGEPGRHLYALAYLAEVPGVLRSHEEKGIPPEISVDTLSDLGLNLRHYRRTWGRFGFDEPAWMGHHFAGQLFAIGRLQYQLGSWWVPVADRAACELAPGDPVLDVHVPETGPLDPAACDESIARARDFFATHHPDFRSRGFACFSWLLGPEVAAYLTPDSNVARFRSRFRRVESAEEHDGQVLKFVFRVPPDAPLDDLPQRTVLERAVVSHLRSGRRWTSGLGYF